MRYAPSLPTRAAAVRVRIDLTTDDIRSRASALSSVDRPFSKDRWPKAKGDGRHEADV